ncbi:probable cytochrome P450 6a14 [Ceratina calcarata]|uniref:Probable cytochrome P450 6a14 n=1 Tax=Ceratina calcarata TaxID=156304 RepID=A0AAJ7NEW1_9HYME|nr:probable cytochrome P450 6a14 [Ceratina calcarata]XP_017891764.1 probable cytochrome P450 6a14 [Ceratina calcarata]XP_026674593.1 probable cytochrome P450 6a14 [Ceratina calcarata]
MSVALLIACVGVAFVWFYLYLTAYHNFWKKRGIPGLKPELAFGNVRMMMTGKESLPALITRLYYEFGNEPLIGFFVRRRPVLLIKDVDLIKEVLIKDFSKFADRGIFATDPANPISDHLFALEERRWRPLRTHLSPVFTSGKLKGTFALILECTKHLEESLDKLVAKGEPIEVKDLASRFTIDVIGSCGFGIEMNSLSETNNEFLRVGKMMFATNFYRVLRIRIQQILPVFHRLLSYVLPPDKEINGLIMKIIRETLEYREKNNIVRPDFMNTLLELKRHPEKVGDIELTEGLLAAQAFVFFAAGFETSSTTIANTLYELAINQEIQNKLRDEIREFEEKNQGEWKYETIKQMKYLHKVFSETLRKYPSLPFLSRVTTEDYKFNGIDLSLPKDSMVWIPIFAIHKDPNIYPDPEKYDPERFSEEMCEQRNQFHYLPFGHGPRNCIGARFANYQTKIGLIKILRKHKVDVCDQTPFPYEYDRFAFVLSPGKSLYLKVTKIDK